MNITEQKITIRELVEGYQDKQEEGVVGYGGKLDIRPPYQREFIYKDKQRDAVIETVRKNFPLNVMYWAVKEDGNFEVMDGQQRTISIAQYVIGNFSYENLYFHSLASDLQEQILNYPIHVYFCEGLPSEKLAWFKIINIAGEKLTDQEMRNAMYSGPWLTDAKRYFSKTRCPAYEISEEYMAGSPNRQEYLETCLDWISNGKIDEYMSEHQHEPNANECWLYFNSVITWVKATFPNYHKEMKGLPWGHVFNEFRNTRYDSLGMAKEIDRLMEDEDITNKKGIYHYLLSGKEKYLNLRAFSPNQKKEAFMRQNGVCPICKKTYTLEEMEADHITPWHLGGKTEPGNCQLLCKEDNRRKGGI